MQGGALAVLESSLAAETPSAIQSTGTVAEIDNEQEEQRLQAELRHVRVSLSPGGILPALSTASLHCADDHVLQMPEIGHTYSFR